MRQRITTRWVVALALLILFEISVAYVVDAREPVELVTSARKAAQTDQNRKAASLFARALDEDPALREAILREYADQLLYAGRAQDAIPLFREVLSKPDLSELDAESARRNFALAYLWSGEYAQAVRAYKEAMRTAPADEDLEKNYVEALVGAAREAAANDQNKASAELFADAIDRAPARRRELIREFADQLTYSGGAAAAVALYREIIATEFHDRSPPAELLSSLGLALLWSNQPREARAVYERVVDLDPNSRDARQNLATALVYIARQEAAVDHNTAAADLFGRALALVPRKRTEWLKEYADQLTYSQRATDSIPFYHEILQWFDLSPKARTNVRLSLALAYSWTDALSEALAEYDALIAEDPGNVRARLGRAEVLSWQERHDAASAELRQILEVAPEDREVQRRLARSESYRGRHRKAVKLAAPLLAADAVDEEAAIVVAESQRWMGRPDAAEQTLDVLLTKQPDGIRAQRLRDELMRDRSPRTLIQTSHSSQSDDLDIWSLGITQEFTLNAGMTSLGPQYQYIRYDPEDGTGVDVARVGAFFRHRFNDFSELNSSFFLDFQDGERNETIFTHNTYLTLFPSDVWRIDFGASRRTLDNIESLNLGLTVDTFSASVDFWPTGTTKLTGRGSWSDYSDGNEQWLFQAEGRQRIFHGPDVWLGARYTTYDFAKRLDNGYFNPDDLQLIELLMQVTGGLWGELSYDLNGTAGLEDADPGNRQFVGSAELKLRYPLTDMVDIEAKAGHFSSALGSDSGFARTTVGLGLSVRW